MKLVSFRIIIGFGSTCCARVSAVSARVSAVSGYPRFPWNFRWKFFRFPRRRNGLQQSLHLLPIKVSILGTRLSIGTPLTSNNISSHSTCFQSLLGVNSPLRSKHHGCTRILGCADPSCVSGILVANCCFLQSRSNSNNFLKTSFNTKLYMTRKLQHTRSRTKANIFHDSYGLRTELPLGSKLINIPKCPAPVNNN